MNKKYCVYLTIYEGTKLPPFYIGSTSIENLSNGYYGSICSKKYKETFRKELKENPQLFDVIILEEFKDRREALAYELEVQKQKDVVKSDLYMNMAFASVDGFFGMSVKGKDSPNYGKKHTEEYRKARSGSNHPLYGTHLTEEQKKAVSKAHLGKKVSKATKLKMSESLKEYFKTNTGRTKNTKWHNNKKINKRIKIGNKIPEGFSVGRINNIQNNTPIKIIHRNHKYDKFLSIKLCSRKLNITRKILSRIEKYSIKYAEYFCPKYSIRLERI
ncbi:MAG: NUMOD3 domain-containing DNA-binding protein [Candidatus Izemoplasma sp.]